MKGIEPSTSARQAGVLPLNYIRMVKKRVRCCFRCTIKFLKINDTFLFSLLYYLKLQKEVYIMTTVFKDLIDSGVLNSFGEDVKATYFELARKTSYELDSCISSLKQIDDKESEAHKLFAQKRKSMMEQGNVVVFEDILKELEKNLSKVYLEAVGICQNYLLTLDKHHFNCAVYMPLENRKELEKRISMKKSYMAEKIEYFCTRIKDLA